MTNINKTNKSNKINKSNKKNKIYNYITKIGVFTALSYLLYLVKFPLPFFPSFLEIQFSNIPLILGGFVLGPVGGIIIAVIRFLFKLLSSHTQFIGELIDLLVSLCVVVTTSLIYQHHKNKKGGIISLIFGTVVWILVACVVNAYIAIPLYSKAFGIDAVISLIAQAIKNITEENFLKYYILYAVIPFNLVLAIIVNLVTFLVYKRISLLFKKDFFKSYKVVNNNQRKALIMCDSFKGTMSSKEVNSTISDCLCNKGFYTETLSISDGGEGFLDTIEEIYPNLKRININTVDAIKRPKSASFLLDDSNPNNKIGYFCLADSVGITYLKKEELSPFKASTYGLGKMFKEAIDKYHVNKIILGIGGSASTDAGTGILQAMGVKFFDENNSLITESGNIILSHIKSIDFTEFDNLIEGVEFKTLTDVTNPLCGPNGAAFVYGPQKGAYNESDVILLDDNLRAFANVLEQKLNISYVNSPGSGAAGGVGYIMKSCFNSQVEVGIDFVLKQLGFEKKSQEYDLIITGEGCFDEQSLNGKVISGIMKFNPKNLKIVCGFNKANNINIPIYSVVPLYASEEESLNNPIKSLRKLIDDVF